MAEAMTCALYQLCMRWVSRVVKVRVMTLAGPFRWPRPFLMPWLAKVTAVFPGWVVTTAMTMAFASAALVVNAMHVRNACSSSSPPHDVGSKVATAREDVLQLAVHSRVRM